MLDRVDAIFTVREYDALACALDPSLKSRPHVFFMRGDTVACERYLMRNALRWRARLRSAITAFVYPLIQGFIFPRVTRIVTVAQFMADAVAARVRRPAPMQVLANDSEVRGRSGEIDDAQEKSVRALKQRDKFVVGVVGQIFWKAKGFDLFLATMRRLKHRADIHAAILGYGSEEHAVPEHIAAYGLSGQVEFLGRAADAYRLMPLFDLVVVPTRFTDANPNVVLEALEADCCILASDIDAHRAQLEYPELLFPNGDEVELARRIVELRDNEGVRVRNRQLVRERREVFHFDWDAAVVNILEGAARSGGLPSAFHRPAVETDAR
jgi:glycosyltransferase involved in cell wall biosynthesis